MRRGEFRSLGQWEPLGTRRGGVAEWLRQGPAKPCTRVRFPPPPRAISSVGERYLDTVEVTGSIPVSPTSTNTIDQSSSDWPSEADRKPSRSPGFHVVNVVLGAKRLKDTVLAVAAASVEIQRGHGSFMT